MLRACSRVPLVLLYLSCAACAKGPRTPGPEAPAPVVVVQATPPPPLAGNAVPSNRREDVTAGPWRPGDPIPEAWLHPELATTRAPEHFAVAFETTKGEFVIRVDRSWAPVGADRLFHLVRIGYYTDIAIFRAIPGFMVQFGIHGIPEVNAAWKQARIPDDPNRASNSRGTLTFAMAGPGTRTVQLFISTTNNRRLDTMNFSPLGEVIAGMDVVDSLYSGYGEAEPVGKGPSQSEMQARGNEYVRAQFPEMDFIRSARLVAAE